MSGEFVCGLREAIEPTHSCNGREGGESDFIGAEMDKGIGQRHEKQKVQIRVKSTNKMVALQDREEYQGNGIALC